MDSERGGRAEIERLARLSEVQRMLVLAKLPHALHAELKERWQAWAHTGQIAPPGDWQIWLIRAGRGFGKTRAGSEWLSEMARRTPGGRFALVGATLDEARRVMVEGNAGLLAVARGDEKLEWRASRGELIFASGARAQIFSADAAEGLRGPEHHAVWADELGKWGRGGETAWDNLMLGLRLGDSPRVLVTTTPRPTRLMRRVMALPGTVETHGRTRDNPHLPASFVAAMEAEYGGTRLGRQELEGEMIDEVAGALWTRAMIETCRGRKPRDVVRVVVGVDPPASAGGDACGIVAVALDAAGIGHVIEDASVAGLSPEGWARAVAKCVARVRADRVVAEKNQGGDMVRSVLRAADIALPLRLVHASRGKAARAEPVAALYEAGRVKHAGRFPALEDELCGLAAGGGYEGPGRSPDRADALVWALNELMLGRRKVAAVRGLG